MFMQNIYREREKEHNFDRISHVENISVNLLRSHAF